MCSPQLCATGKPVRMWTYDFAKWWFVCRLVEVNNFIFMRHLRGTALLNWFYRALVRPSSQLTACCRHAQCLGWRHIQHTEQQILPMQPASMPSSMRMS